MCMCVRLRAHCPVWFFFFFFCAIVSVCVCHQFCKGENGEGGGGRQKMIRGPIHMKQEGSYINIAPRPRGQAIYEANCSPVSHGGRAVYYA